MGIPGTHEDVGHKNWVSQEHMRMLVTEIGYPQKHMRMFVTEPGYHRNTIGCLLQKLGITGTHEDVGYGNWASQEHKRNGLQKLCITRTHEDVGYGNWAS